ncbi:MAG: Putative membrane protein insertion efficiency factor [Holosporales bacterium]
MKKLIIVLIRLYQMIISPYLKGGCRFIPTCSCYAHEAFEKHGTLKGCRLTLKRILKCQPFYNKKGYQGEYDPVP